LPHKDPEQKRAYLKVWRERHPDYQREYRATTQYTLWWRHGLRPEDWAQMWAAQNGCCYLCGKPLTFEDAALDHDHSCCPSARSCSTCQRGLAHNSCNRAIGLAGDSPATLRRMADALERAQAEAAKRMAEKPSQLELGEVI
jgi:Recombination endonuclease VII